MGALSGKAVRLRQFDLVQWTVGGNDYKPEATPPQILKFLLLNRRNVQKLKFIDLTLLLFDMICRQKQINSIHYQVLASSA